jgi:hypothetical protein
MNDLYIASVIMGSIILGLVIYRYIKDNDNPYE